MKRYLLFAGETRGLGGGWDNFIKDFDDHEYIPVYKGLNSIGNTVYRIRNNIEDGLNVEHEWYHVVDIQTGTIIKESIHT